MKRKIILITAIFTSFVLFATDAKADDIVISGNGSGSENNVTINNSSSSNTTQQNTATVDNNVDVNANTGNNSVNENTTGDVSVTTGDTKVTSTVTNELNSSTVNNDCNCSAAPTNVEISGNGADSTNNVNLTNNNLTTVTVSQTANITNNVNGNANTGENKANNNTGSNVSITTGNIHAKDTIKNIGINIYNVNVPSGNNSSVFLSISGNGADSVNSIKFVNNNDVSINVSNSANIINDSNWDLNTGKNEANGNTGGDVIIATGDIYFDSLIENGPINGGTVDVDCGCKDTTQPPDDGGTPPNHDGNIPPIQTNPGIGGGPGDGKSDGRSDGRSDGKSVLAAVLGTMLPATGGMLMYLITLLGIMMFLMGWYLRLTSGNSPPRIARA